MPIVVTDTTALETLIPAVLKQLNGRKKIALSGEMGAGKTTLVAALCKYLKVHQSPASPTFSLINEYSFTDEEGREQIIRHMDLYRLKNLQEALDIGLEDYLYDGSYCLIEWPQLILEMLPEDTAFIHLEIGDNNSRIIHIDH